MVGAIIPAPLSLNRSALHLLLYKSVTCLCPQDNFRSWSFYAHFVDEEVKAQRISRSAPRPRQGHSVCLITRPVPQCSAHFPAFCSALPHFLQMGRLRLMSGCDNPERVTAPVPGHVPQDLMASSGGSSAALARRTQQDIHAYLGFLTGTPSHSKCNIAGLCYFACLGLGSIQGCMDLGMKISF